MESSGSKSARKEPKHSKEAEKETSKPSKETPERSKSRKSKSHSSRSRRRSQRSVLPNERKFDDMKAEMAAEKQNPSESPKETKSQPTPQIPQPIIPQIEKAEELGIPVPGENFQRPMEHGAHLLEFPFFSVTLDFVELGIAALGSVLALIGSAFLLDAAILLIFNSVLIVGLIAALLIIQWYSLHVETQNQNNSITASARRYMGAIHLMRLCVVASTVAILLYYGFCGDTGFRKKSICEAMGASAILFFLSSAVFVIQLALIGTHLFFYCKNRFAIRTL